MKKFQLWYYRRGIIIGAMVGIVYAWYMIQNDYTTLSQIFQATKGYLDTWMARSSAASIETTKIYVFFGGIGAMVGWLSEFILLYVFKIYGRR